MQVLKLMCLYAQLLSFLVDMNLALQGVQQLHSMGRSHNDLKPDNILVRNYHDAETTEVVIIDIAGSMEVGTCKFHCTHICRSCLLVLLASLLKPMQHNITDSIDACLWNVLPVETGQQCGIHNPVTPYCL